jgi:hypothetical protein
MSSGRRTVGFGCPDTIDPHHFVVTIPRSREGAVRITEMYGLDGGRQGTPDVLDRVEVPREIWQQLADALKRSFNERLKEKKLTTSRWLIGDNKVERLLGKELLVLAWAVERADPAVVPVAVRNWSGLRPEERWWLFTMTAAATGGIDDGDIGWRKALRFALTENPLPDELALRPTLPRRPLLSKTKDERALPIVFEENDG